MKKIKIIIIDDEPDSIEVLQLLMADNENVSVIDSVHSVNEGIVSIERELPDLVLLDIEMPGQNGFALLKQYKNLPFKVIFVTGYDHYAIKAIKFSALDYMLKPIDKTELDQAIQKAILSKQEDIRIENLQRFSEIDFYEKLIIHTKQGFKSITLNEIVSIESISGNYASFFFEDGSKMLCSKSLKYYEEILPKSIFFRIHKSYIINLNKVSNFSNSDNNVELANGKKMDVAHRRKSKFYAAINQLAAV